MPQDGRNPASIIPGVMHRFIDDHRGRRAAIIAEPMWAGRSTAEYTACLEHEALINLALAQQTADILCRYDVASLPRQTLADVQRTHPVLREKATQRINTHYQDPAIVLESISNLQPQTPQDAAVFRFSEVAEARRMATEWGAASGLPTDHLTDLLIAISEVAGNSVEHAGDGGTMRYWRHSGSLIYEIRDRGHIRIASPDGCLPHGPRVGRGLLMVNLLCDLVQLRSGPSGTTVRTLDGCPHQLRGAGLAGSTSSVAARGPGLARWSTMNTGGLGAAAGVAWERAASPVTSWKATSQVRPLAVIWPLSQRMAALKQWAVRPFVEGCGGVPPPRARRRRWLGRRPGPASRGAP